MASVVQDTCQDTYIAHEVTRCDLLASCFQVRSLPYYTLPHFTISSILHCLYVYTSVHTPIHTPTSTAPTHVNTISHPSGTRRAVIGPPHLHRPSWCDGTDVPWSEVGFTTQRCGALIRCFSSFAWRSTASDGEAAHTYVLGYVFRIVRLDRTTYPRV